MNMAYDLTAKAASLQAELDSVDRDIKYAMSHALDAD